MSDGIIARIDPELDEIRHGNVDSGNSIANINALSVQLSGKWKVRLMEELIGMSPQACATSALQPPRPRPRTWR